VAKRRRSIVWIVGLILLGAIGVLWALGNVGRKPEEIKAELEARIEELNRIPAEEPVRKDDLARELLANDDYKNHAKALWLRLEKAQRSLHDAAQLDRAAQKDVPPFLARSKDLSRIERTDLQNLIGECSTLIASYGATRFGDALRQRRDELTAKLESLPKPATASDVMDLSRRVLLAQNEGRHSDPLDIIDEFLKRPGANDHRKMIDTMIETTNSKAQAAADAMLEKARMQWGRGGRTQALQMLDRSEPDFRRFPKVVAAIEALRRTIRSR
jgi:hypothetical protein